MCGSTREPAHGLGDGEVYASDDEDQSPRAAIAVAREVGRFGFR